MAARIEFKTMMSFFDPKTVLIIKVGGRLLRRHALTLLISFPEALGAASRARLLYQKHDQKPKRHPKIYHALAQRAGEFIYIYIYKYVYNMI